MLCSGIALARATTSLVAETDTLRRIAARLARQRHRRCAAPRSTWLATGASGRRQPLRQRAAAPGMHHDDRGDVDLLVVHARMPLEVIDKFQSVAEHVDHATNRPDIGRRQVGFSIDETDQLLQGVEKPGVAEIGEPDASRARASESSTTS